MSIISGPFVRYNCAECGHEVERQISARRAVAELEELTNGPDLVCAGCWNPAIAVERIPEGLEK